MPDYFLVHDRHTFEQVLRPALAESWRRRHFAPCLDVARTFAPDALDFAKRFHLAPEFVVLQVPHDLSFDRDLWRTLVGELLLFAARDIPEIPAHLEALAYLLAPDRPLPDLHQRSRLPLIHQVLHGSHDLTFGRAIYRPDHAGYNDAADVARLAGSLAAISRGDWRPDDLAMMPGLDEEDRVEELTFAQEWFAVLVDLHVRAARADQVVVLESIH